MTINALLIALALTVLLYVAAALGPRPRRVQVRIDTPRDQRFRRQQ